MDQWSAFFNCDLCSVAKSCLTLWPPGLQHTGLLCPSLSLRICSDSRPLSQWCYPTISSSAASSFCLQSFPTSGSFPLSQLLASGGQSTGASASASALPMKTQGWFPLGFTNLIFLKSKGLSRVFSSITVWKHQFFSAQPSLWINAHIHTWPLNVICYIQAVMKAFVSSLTRMKSWDTILLVIVNFKI